LCLLYYFSRIKACENYNWLIESHEKKIESELNNLYSTLGQFHNLSETIIQHALSSSDCKVKFFHYTGWDSEIDNYPL